MKQFFRNNIGFCISFIVVILLLPFIKTIPFFWDMGYISEVADHIYTSNFASFVKPEIDNGTPPLFSFLLASVWKLFGKSLLISHIFSSIIFVGLLWQFNVFTRFFVKNWIRHFAILLLMVDPVISTQSVLMGYDIAIVFFAFLALNSILLKRNIWLMLALIPIPLLNLRGFSIVLSIFLFQLVYTLFLQKEKVKFSTFLMYVPSIFLVSIWFLYHKSVSGFYAVSIPNNELHQFGGINWMLKNFVFSMWKLLDFNRIFIFIVIGFLLFKKYKTNSNSAESKSIIRFFLLSILVFLVPFFIFFLPFHYPVGHRYFMLPILLAIVFLIYLLKDFKKMTQIITLFSIAFLLLAGNFYLYPTKYGNGWDSSLKVLPYFEIKDEAIDYLTNNNAKNIAAQFPEIRNQKYFSLNPAQDISFKDLNVDSLKTYDFLVYSNCYNVLPLPLSSIEKAGFVEVKKLQSGQSYIKIYKNSKNIQP